MKIVIITRGRVGNVRTMDSIPTDWMDRTYICCPADEAYGHKDLGATIIPEPHPMNYSQKFNWLVNGGCGVLGRRFVIMDDDLRFSARAEDGKLIMSTEDHRSAGLAKLEEMLDTYPLAGLHPRAMGNNAPRGIKEINRINALQAVNLDLIGPIKLDYWSILADMVLNLRLLTTGRKTAVWCELFWDQVGQSNAPGGCSLHRTAEVQTEAVLGLAALFPEFVTVKEKEIKGGGGFWSKRTDFVIQWKKAYEQGIKLGYRHYE